MLLKLRLKSSPRYHYLPWNSLLVALLANCVHLHWNATTDWRWHESRWENDVSWYLKALTWDEGSTIAILSVQEQSGKPEKLCHLLVTYHLIFGESPLVKILIFVCILVNEKLLRAFHFVYANCWGNTMSITRLQTFERMNAQAN